MIFDREPSTWQELQNFVAQVFTEIGCDARIEHSLTTVRGSINIDVYVEDKIGTPPLIYLCECKHWNSRVPKSIVHSFRSVVSDVGANRGLIISKTGFQAGAFEAAEHSIIELLTWDGFQKTFYERWLQTMSQRLAESADQIFKYMSMPPLLDRDYDQFPGSRDWSDERWWQYIGYFHKKYGLLTRAMTYSISSMGIKKEFPLDVFIPHFNVGNQSIDWQILKLFSYREYFDFAFPLVQEALTEFKGIWKDKP